jgi:excinuclease ABC subunit C
MREGDIVGRREFFWEELSETHFNPAEFLSEVLSQYYSRADSGPSLPATDLRMQEGRVTFMPREIHVPIDFADRELLEKVLTERKGRRVHILAPQRGEKRDMIDLVEKNAKLALNNAFACSSRYEARARRDAGDARAAAISGAHRIFRRFAHSGR